MPNTWWKKIYFTLKTVKVIILFSECKKQNKSKVNNNKIKKVKQKINKNKNMFVYKIS